MARLPSGEFLMQRIGREVVLFEDGTERELLRFVPSDPDSVAKAQKVIHDSELGPEDKSFAHMWSGYFYRAAVEQEPRVIPLDVRANGVTLFSDTP